MILAFPFVGRENEKKFLLDQINSVEKGKGGLVLVGGEAGMGKTTLIQTTLTQLDSIYSLTSRCPDLGESSPFAPWLEALRQIESDFQLGLQQLPAPFGQRHLNLNTYELALSIIDWFNRLQVPTVIIIEDLQWADTATLDLLRYLSDRLIRTKVLVIATYRTENLSNRLPLWKLIPELLRNGAKRVNLDRLSLDHIKDLLIQLGNEDATVAEAIFGRTAGLPLFVYELVHAMDETGTFSVANISFSDTVQQVIDMRMSQIKPETQEVLQIAAIIGERFRYSLLAQVLDCSPEELTAALEDGIRNGVIRSEHSDSAINEFSFHHAIVRDVLQQRLIGVHQIRYHIRIAEALLQSTRNDTTAIAYHFHMANDPRAIHFLIESGNHALQIGAMKEAEKRYQVAAKQMTPHDTRRGEVLLKLGYCMQYHSVSKAKSLWEEVLKLADTIQDQVLKAWAWFFLLQLKLNKRDKTCLTEIPELKQLQETLLHDLRYQDMEKQLFGTNSGYPHACRLEWGVLLYQGKLNHAQTLLDGIIQQIENPNMELFDFGMNLAVIKGQPEEALRCIREAVRLAISQSNYWHATRIQMNELHFMNFFMGDEPSEVDRIAQQLIALEEEAYTKSGYAYLPHGFSSAGFYQYGRGDWKNAWHNVLTYVTNELQPLPLITWFAAVMLYETGNIRKMASVLKKLHPLKPTAPEPAGSVAYVWNHAIRAFYHMGKNEMELAKAWLDAADAHPIGGISKSHRPYVDLAWATYHKLCGNLEQAWDICSKGLEQAKAIPIPWFAIKLHRLLGEIAEEMNKWQDALLHHHSALDYAKQCCVPYEVALTCIALARTYRNGNIIGSTDTTINYVTQANEILTKLQASSELVNLDPILAQVQTLCNPKTSECITIHSLRELTKREEEIAWLVSQGLSDKEIAQKLCISPKTVDHHMRNIFRKLMISNRTALVAYTFHNQSKKQIKQVPS